MIPLDSALMVLSPASVHMPLIVTFTMCIVILFFTRR